VRALVVGSSGTRGACKAVSAAQVRRVARHAVRAWGRSRHARTGSESGMRMPPAEVALGAPALVRAHILAQAPAWPGWMCRAHCCFLGDRMVLCGRHDHGHDPSASSELAASDRRLCPRIPRLSTDAQHQHPAPLPAILTENDMSPRRRGRRRVTESPEVGRAFARNFGK